MRLQLRDSIKYQKCNKSTIRLSTKQKTKIINEVQSKIVIKKIIRILEEFGILLISKTEIDKLYLALQQLVKHYKENTSKEV